MTPLSERLNAKDFLIISHRGNGFSIMENTCNALQKSVAHGAEMIEFDVQLSKDQQLVLFHDKDTKRLFPDRSPLTISESMQPDLQLDTLDQLFALKLPCYYYIELKTYSKDSHSHHILAKKTVELISQFKLENQVIVVSFEANLLRFTYQSNPSLLLGLNCNNHSEHTLQSLTFPIHCLCPHSSLLTPEYLNTYKQYAILPFGKPDILLNHPELLKGLNGYTSDDLSISKKLYSLR